MFGIDDPGIILPYLLAVCCLIFSLWFGISRWNREDSNHSQKQKK